MASRCRNRITGVTATLAPQKATATISVVFHTGGDLVEFHLVASLSHPGGNVTGVISLGKRQAFPPLSHSEAARERSGLPVYPPITASNGPVVIRDLLDGSGEQIPSPMEAV